MLKFTIWNVYFERPSFMNAHYQEIVDEIFGSQYKHRTLRTIFDPNSSEWNDTTIEKKLKILKKILESKKINLEKVDNRLQKFLHKGTFQQRKRDKLSGGWATYITSKRFINLCELLMI